MIRRRVLLLILGLPAAAGAMPGPAQAKDILGTATDAGTFTTFLAGVNAAGLTDLLAGAGPLTVFAPTDDAFARLPRATLDGLMAPEGRGRLRALLLRHLVMGKITARDVLGRRMEAATADGALVLVDATGVVTVGGARLVRADIAADNGLIHVIDSVLMPE